MIKRWRKCLMRSVSYVMTLLLGAYLCHTFLEKEKNKYLEFFNADGQVFVGVAIPSDASSGSHEKDLLRMQGFLGVKEDIFCQYVATYHEPFNCHYKVFIFEVLVVSEVSEK